jgi:hypothetical protein
MYIKALCFCLQELFEKLINQFFLQDYYKILEPVNLPNSRLNADDNTTDSMSLGIPRGCSEHGE